MINSLKLLALTAISFVSFELVAAVPPFSDNPNPIFENTYLIDNLGNNSRGADLTLRVHKSAPFGDCNNKVDCPASVIISNATGNVNMPVDVNVRSLYVGKTEVIDASGKWVGSPTGLMGPQGPKGETGPTGKSGESCTQGAGIYPACLNGLLSQKLFKFVKSENMTQDCIYSSGAFQKKFSGVCPASHPNVIGGGCELRVITPGISLTSSEPLSSGSGWQCEMIAVEGHDCSNAVVRVWASCANVGVDIAAIGG